MTNASTIRHYWKRCTQRALTISLLVTTGLCLVLFTGTTSHDSGIGYLEAHLKHRPSQDSTARYASPRGSKSGLPPFCGNFDVSNIAISIKTGATEARNRVPTQLMTFLHCIPDVMIFSDLDQTLGDKQMHDVLSRFSEAAMKGNDEFEIYLKQQELANHGREADLPSLSSIPITTQDWRTEGKNAAWGLDKYKFLYMVERAWELQPDRDWYVFLEADTYLSISNLLQFLNAQDSKEKLYFGNSLRMWEHPTPLNFAHGGSGFILSGATVKDFAVTHEGIPAKFDQRVRDWWYGDFVLADALDEELHIQVTDATPMLNSDEPSLIPFGEHVWCKPVITLHHMDARQFDDMYKFQRAHLPSRREAWDNLSDDGRFALDVVPNDVGQVESDVEPNHLVDPHQSYEACEVACSQIEQCFQFSFTQRAIRMSNGDTESQTECHMSSVFRLGREAQPNESKGHRDSGWNSERIANWIEEHRDCGENEDWST
ncbi:hypothetical protein LTR37_001741 [Vermiconidia calcicola]|uniref:Uncharacterized protein n=1 Tax=Vermiconidia calcicola TaxID=1690605 RepID=A0ACC3NWD5_9PEZI|nr:hypothetical protein LTR37_001741 [Vermiconidia calcicola]